MNIRLRCGEWSGGPLPPAVEVGEGRVRVHLELVSQGRDLVLLLGGGATHAGAVAVAGPGGEELGLCQLPHHREGPLAARCARELARAAGCVCTVVAGIHQDGATPVEIAAIVANAEEGARRLAAALDGRSSQKGTDPTA